MKKFVALSLMAVLVCVAGIPGSSVAAEEATPSLIVLPLTPQGVGEDVAASLTDLLALELEKTQLYEVMSQEDLKALMTHQGVLQMMGEDNEEELVKLGKKLDADLLLRGSVGKVGAVYLLSLTLLDVPKAEVVRRVNQSLNGDPEDLIGSLHSAVVALALEEKGFTKDITADVIDDINIARKNKHMFLTLRTGYELNIGPVTNDSSFAYMLPDMFNVNLSAGFHVLPWMQIVAETGFGTSIMSEYSMQTKRVVLESVPNTSPQEFQRTTTVNMSKFNYQTMRVPLLVMTRFQPATGRLLPFAQLGIGMSWQRYTVENEEMQLLKNVSQGVGGDSDSYTPLACNDPAFPQDANGDCRRNLTIKPMEDTYDYFNIHVPVSVGIEYLLTQNFGFGFEVRYNLTYSLNKSEDDLFVDFVSDEPVDYGNGTKGAYGDAVPIRRLHHGISVMAGVFYYY